jgi:lactocepin
MTGMELPSLANYFNPENKRVLLATGLEFADALTGAALAAKEGCGLFLLDDEIPDGIMQYLKDKEIIHFTILGGTEAVGKRIEGQLLK